MMRFGLSAADHRVLHDTLLSDHAMRITVHSLDLNGDYDSDLSGLLTDGQVDVDGTADITRTASLTLLDLNRSLDFDADSPSESALFINRMISIEYGVRCEFADRRDWIDIPIFVGPITTLSRTGAELQVEAQGKEALCMGAVWRPLTIRKGAPKTRAIRTILAERAGERHFDIADLQAKLPKPVTLGRHDIPWNHARSIAASMDRQLYYDGRGACKLRRRPERPVFTYTADSILSEVAVSYTQDNVVNCVFVRGGVPKHGKLRIAAEVFPAFMHPLSPWRLGRHDVPRFLMASIENTHIRSYAEARRRGRQRLRRGLAEGIEVSFDAMPVPTLEPGDMIRAHTGDGTVTFVLNTFSVPLVAGNAMTVGYNRNLRRRGRGPLRVHRRTGEWRAEMRAARQQQDTRHRKGAPRAKTHHATRHHQRARR